MPAENAPIEVALTKPLAGRAIEGRRRVLMRTIAHGRFEPRGTRVPDLTGLSRADASDAGQQSGAMVNGDVAPDAGVSSQDPRPQTPWHEDERTIDIR